MKAKYKAFAPCGFCRFFGRKSDSYDTDVCRDCEIRKIRENLDNLSDAVLWEHDHKYRGDNEEGVRNCAHCKHASPFNTLYHAAQYADLLCCELDGENLGDDDYYPKRSALSVCEHWERAVDRSS